MTVLLIMVKLQLSSTLRIDPVSVKLLRARSKNPSSETKQLGLYIGRDE